MVAAGACGVVTASAQLRYRVTGMTAAPTGCRTGDKRLPPGKPDCGCLVDLRVGSAHNWQMADGRTRVALAEDDVLLREGEPAGTFRLCGRGAGRQRP
jgi:hypothetical protein